MNTRGRAVVTTALVSAALLLSGCGSVAGETSTGADGAEASATPSHQQTEQASIRDLIAEGTSPAPVPPDSQPLAPDGSGPVDTGSARIEDATETARPRPTGLRIPALGVDAPVAAFGVADDGEMDAPSDATTVAWYEHGPSPGQPGSSVLAAHVDYDGARGVFFDLAQLTVGDEVTVLFAGGRSRTFVVDRQDSVTKDVLPVDELFERDGPARLTLITCGGQFDAAARSYRSNVVVRTVPADSAG